MKVKEWLPGFLVRHQARHPRLDWPDDARHQRLWLDALLMLEPKPKEIEAELASRDLDSSALAWPEDHPLAVVRLIRQARERPVALASGPVQPTVATMTETSKQQAVMLLAELERDGWEFAWDPKVNHYRCVRADGAYSRVPDELGMRIRALARELWILLEPTDLAAIAEPIDEGNSPF